jgi:hypothetical protein
MSYNLRSPWISVVTYTRGSFSQKEGDVECPSVEHVPPPGPGAAGLCPAGGREGHREEGKTETYRRLL